MQRTDTYTKPLVSVIVPFYNVEKYARDCIESIRNQSLEDIEIILVDDGSPDACGAICDRFAEIDPRIKVIHQQNGGISSARNAALEIASADIIGFVDSDDWIERDMFRDLYDAIVRTGADIVMCNYFIDYTNRSILKPFPDDLADKCIDSLKAVDLLLEDKHVHNYIWNKVFKRKVITETFPIGKNFEDMRVVVKWFDAANCIYILNKPYYHYIQRATSTVWDESYPNKLCYIDALRTQLDYICEKNYPEDIYTRHLIRYVKCSIGMARDTARKSTYDRSMALFFSDILSCLKPYESKFLHIISGKLRRRYKMLSSHPRMFYYSVNFNKHFIFKRYLQNKAKLHS